MKVRALTFRKRFANSTHENAWWATLGHPDEMECSELKDMALEDICKINNDTFKKDSEDAYHHVIYLIDSGFQNSNQAADKDLWNLEHDFLSVTRIHFPNMTNLQDQYHKLTEYFSQLSSQDPYKEIVWRSYYTVELSDMVLVSRSKQFRTLSWWSLLTTKSKLIGNAYTYFCIPGALLSLSEADWPKALKNDFADFVAIRFAIRGYGAEEKLRDVRTCLGERYTDMPFRVAGNEDAIICGRNIPMWNLLKLYQNWYQDETILKVFRDIITRIGANWERTPPKQDGTNGNESDETTLEKCTRILASKVRNKVLPMKVNDVPLESREWMRPLVELTNALVHMSCSATLDETVFQILPGLNAFWDNVIDETNPLLDESLYLRFAELGVHTMEHLMRAEGQLSTRPEVRPLAYDIPVFVLEYATAFLLTLSNELAKPDGDDAERICFLLVPSAEKDVSTVEPFRATKDTPGLLVITVPFSLLYKPKQLLAALCHEVAHYVGETLRMRDVRYKHLLDCTSYELQKRFFKDISGRKEMFSRYITTEFLDKNLRDGASLFLKTDGDGFIKIPLYTIMEMIFKVVGELVDADAYAQFARDYVLSDYRGSSFGSILDHERIDALQHFVDRIRDLSISFRETYADICMLHFLKLSPIDYLEVSLRQWEDINTSTFLRAYVTLSTAGNSLQEIQQAMDHWGRSKQASSEDRDWAANELKVIADLINDDDEKSSEQLLATYIRQCWEELNKKCPCDGEKTKGYNNTSKEIFDKILALNTTSYQDILAVIDNGRQIALKQLDETLSKT